MKNYIKRLNDALQRDKNCAYKPTIHDRTCLFSDFMLKRTWHFNYVWKQKIRPEAQKYYNKRIKKDDFDRKLFSKVIFNKLYDIRQQKNDGILYGTHPSSDIYKYLASHQYVRRELTHMSVDDIILLSWALAKTIKRKEAKNGQSI